MARPGGPPSARASPRCRSAPGRTVRGWPRPSGAAAPERASRPPGSSRSWRRRVTPTPSSSCGSWTPNARTRAGRCASHRWRTAALRTSPWMRSGLSCGKARVGNAASVPRGSAGCRWRMFEAVGRSSNYLSGDALYAVYSLRLWVGVPCADLVLHPGTCGPNAKPDQPAR
jgi:hypothetical protein